MSGLALVTISDRWFSASVSTCDPDHICHVRLVTPPLLEPPVELPPEPPQAARPSASTVGAAMAPTLNRTRFVRTRLLRHVTEYGHSQTRAVQTRAGPTGRKHL